MGVSLRATDQLKTVSERAIQKMVKATSDLVGNKIENCRQNWKS